MVSDWLKTQKIPPRTNQILAVVTTKLKKMAMFFGKQQFDFVHKTTIEEFQKPKHSKKYVFMAKCMY